MANGLNKAFLIGNLGIDPELKYTTSGQAVLRMRIATSESWVDKQGEKQERTEWHTVIIWGKRAEALSKFLRKGEKVYIEGRIQHRQWETDAGEKRTSTEINASELILLGGKREGGSSSSSGDFGGRSSNGGGGGAPVGASDDFGDDDIPFAPVDGRLP